MSLSVATLFRISEPDFPLRPDVDRGHPVGRISALSFLALVGERVLAFVLLAIVAALYGLSAESDTYFLALILPTAFGIALSEAAYTVLLPLFGRDPIPSRPLLRRALAMTAAATSFLAALYVAGVLLIAAHDVSLWLLFTPVLLAMPLSGVYAAFFTAHRRYALASMRVPLASAVAVLLIAALLPFWRSTVLLALGIAIGQLAALLFLAGRARSMPAPRTSLEQPVALAGLAGAAGSVVFASLIAGLGVVPVERFLAIGLEEGAIALLALARAVSLLPVLVPQALGNGVFPAATQHHLALDRDALARLAVVGLRLGLLAALVSTAFLVVCREELIRIAFERRAFTEQETERTAELLAILAPSLLGISAATIANKALFAVGRQRVVAAISAAGVASYLALALVLREIWGVEGLAAAFTLSAVFAGGLLVVFLAAHVGIGVLRASREWVAAPVLHAITFSAGSYAGWRVLAESGGGFGRALLTVAVSLLAGAALLAIGIVHQRGTEYAVLRAALVRRDIGAVREQALSDA